jgi:glucokinase
MSKYAIGADIGGSHISCAAIDLEKKTIVRESFATHRVNNQASANEILDNWVLALNQTISKINRKELLGVGFAMPGPFDYDKGIAQFTHEVAKFEKLFGMNVAEAITQRLSLTSSDDVRFMNDASAFAVGEAWFGKAANVKRSVAITLGTGFGSAFIDAGLPVVKRDDVPRMGCVWHLPFNDGIADDSFSTRWFIRRYAEKTGLTLDGVKDIANKVTVDANAAAIFEEFGNNLAAFLGSWLKTFDAEALVIGGNISGAFKLFGGSFQASLKEQNVSTKIYLSGLKEEAALIGSARMFESSFWGELKPLLSQM